MRMNHCVPHFEMEQEDQSIPIPTSSGLTRQHNTRQEDEIMELLWQNGQVVFQSQNQNKFPRRSPQPQQQHQQQAQPVCDSTSHLFMQEDEMSTWLHFPPDYSSGGGGDIYADLLYTPPPPPPPPPTANATAHAVEVQQTDSPHLRPQLSPTLPPPPPQVMQPVAPNFAHFSRMRPLPPSMFADTGPPTTSRHDQHHHHHHNNNNNSHHTDARERESTTVVDSSDTPMAAAGISRPNRVSHHHHMVRNRSTADATTDEAGWSFGGRDTMMSGGGGGGLGGVGREKAEGGGGCLSASRDGETCELTLTSTSPGGSGASASETATGADDTTEVRAPLDDRKRKSRENAAAGTDCHSEDVEIESAEAKKQCRGSAGTKRSRAAEVHNLSERRRRDRINEKMKALQELIPRCSKTDKASMLDEAIEYLKSLQLQVQVMTSMGCGMIPMMFPGVQQYMPHMGMGMGMGMSMDMGMNRPMMPFPALLAGSALQPSGVAPHMGPRFQIPGFPMPPPVPPPDMSRIQVTGQADLAVNPLGLSGQPTLPIMPNMADPYQQYLRMQQMQNQPIAQPSTSKPSTSKGSSGRENPRNG